MMLEAVVEDMIKDGSDKGDKTASDVPMCSIVDDHVELGDGAGVWSSMRGYLRSGSSNP